MGETVAPGVVASGEATRALAATVSAGRGGGFIGEEASSADPAVRRVFPEKFEDCEVAEIERIAFIIPADMVGGTEEEVCEVCEVVDMDLTAPMPGGIEGNGGGLRASRSRSDSKSVEAWG